MVQRLNMTLANELLMLRISLGFPKQEPFALHLGISTRHYTRMEKHGFFTRKMVTKIRLKYADFAKDVHY